jgi:hypothetical protein
MLGDEVDVSAEEDEQRDRAQEPLILAEAGRLAGRRLAT